MFKTNIAGRPVIISADPEFNNFILKQDGKLVDTWSLDTFAEVFEQNTHSSRKYTRHLTLNHFGVEALKEKLLPQMENYINLILEKWSGHESLEVKSAAIKVSKLQLLLLAYVSFYLCTSRHFISFSYVFCGHLMLMYHICFRDVEMIIL